ncbi:hypothetical protein EMCRGX_G023982 [Ephydatia muelleri]
MMRKVIRDHDEVIRDHDEVIRDHDEVIRDHDEVIRDHDEVIRDHDEVIRDHDEGKLLEQLQARKHVANDPKCVEFGVDLVPLTVERLMGIGVWDRYLCSIDRVEHIAFSVATLWASKIFDPCLKMASNEDDIDYDELGGVTRSIALNETFPLLSQKLRSKKLANQKKLGTIFGVTIPCTLTILSVLLFLRLGFVLGQAGYLTTLGMLVIGYTVAFTTILSISAIVTSVTVEGGGVYFLVSRSLGPELGGAIGTIFYVANIFGSTSYIIGVVEVIDTSIGVGGTLVKTGQGIPAFQYWYDFLYGTVVLLFVLVVCLVGAKFFTKTTTVTFIIVLIAIASVMFSFGFVPERTITSPPHNPNPDNITLVYTSWSWQTFKENLGTRYSIDYTDPSEGIKDFKSVFAIFFSGCIGIMGGVNISGDLKNPSRAIPEGTILALGITLALYLVMFTFTAFTCGRDLLINNYNFLYEINAAGPIISVSVFAITLSASLANLIGATKILHAVAKDKLFGNILHPFTWTVGKSKQPFMAVLFSWFIVQMLLFLHHLNSITPLTTIFFIISYGVVNMSCFILKMTSAPNFRPTFEVHPKFTSALGTISCLVMMFFINAIYAGVTIALLLAIVIYLLIRGPAKPWGEVSQAIIYHQVRKFLLRLDIRKSHVRFWRPEVLLLVSNPRSAYHLIEFTNDLKKGGLYVMGHVMAKPLDFETAHQYTTQLQTWLSFVDITNVKAFVEITISASVRAGVQSLLTTAGLGGMKPNMVILGLYTSDLPISTMETLHVRLLKRPKIYDYLFRDKLLEKYRYVDENLPNLRTDPGEQSLDAAEYISMIQDAVTLGKNICVTHNFDKYEKSTLKRRPYIDVWPLQVTKDDQFDSTCLLILQLACVLHMKDKWKATEIRVFVVVGSNVKEQKRVFESLLMDTRIKASIHFVDPAYAQERLSLNDDLIMSNYLGGENVTELQYCHTMNSLFKQYSPNSSVIFTALPEVPTELSMSTEFITKLKLLSSGTVPIIMARGISQVMVTNF